MRTGGCRVQQALTAEAASVVKQAVTLASQRGHAQVTPLHIANTMLAASSGMLRTACLQSHSHPLQCKALELCFNVALNRVPASTSIPMSGTHGTSQNHPSISNALVAAFKRAQAHQRRGSIENQQQPLLTVKIELEQLTISILDDPSVSRVMREAGFSSTQVKSNIEQAVSLEICSQSAPSVMSSSKSKESNVLPLSQSPPLSTRGAGAKPSDPITVLDHPIRSEDVMSVMDNLMNKRRRSIVIVGECISNITSVVQAVMDKVHKGDVQVPEGLREVKFLTYQISSLEHLTGAQVEQKVEELKGLVRNHMSKRGVVLNLGDLKWVAEDRTNSRSCEQGRDSNFYFLSPIEYMVTEVGNLVCGIRENYNDGKFWVMGMATLQTYMKYCNSGHPSLETLWGLHALTIPSGSCLRLSLTTDSKSTKDGCNWIGDEGVEEKQLMRCCDCSANLDQIQSRSRRSLTCDTDTSTSSSTLPAWLQRCQNVNNIAPNNDGQDCHSIKDLGKNWNSIHHHQQQPYFSEKTLTISSLSPSDSTSILSYEQQHNHNSLQTHHDWPMDEPQQQPWRDQHSWIDSETNVNKDAISEPILRMYVPEHNFPPSNQPFSWNPNSTPNSTSSSDAILETEHRNGFKKLNSENLKILVDALEKKVPWQRDIIPEIVSTILQCRSGMVRRNKHARNSLDAKEETWLFFQGADMGAKEEIARELARVVFGNDQNSFVSISLSSFSSTRADSTEDNRNKRSRDEQSSTYIQRFAEALTSNPHRVFVVEDVEQADYWSQIGLKRAMERGNVTNANGEEVLLSDAIIILSCESFSSRSRACSPPIRQKMEGSQEGGATEDTTGPFVSLDLNISIADDNFEDQSIDDIALLESVDRRIVFKIQEL